MKQNEERDKSKMSSLKSDSKHGMFNHDIPHSRAYDFADQAYKQG
jgi:hypothetical protein